ncbi:hypothetical protein ACUNME_003225 [Vibrio cholerae]
MSEPIKLQAGDSITWSREAPGYPAEDGWSLHYALRGPAPIDLSTTGDGAVYQVSVSAADSAKWSAGDYVFSCFVVKGEDRQTLGTGRLTILPDLAATNPVDARSHAKRMLDAIEATLEKRATRDQQSYEIEGRRLDRIPIPELLKLRDRYRREHQRELEQAGLRPRRQSFIRVSLS